MKNKAIFAGSFDPISLAHIDILKKSESLFSKVYLCVSKNIAKKPLFTMEERTQIAKAATKDFQNVEIINSEDKLTAIIAKEKQVGYLIRGLRTDHLFVNEYELAGINRVINPGLETLIFFTAPEYSLISSTVIRELLIRKLPIDKYVVESSIETINAIMKRKQ